MDGHFLVSVLDFAVSLIRFTLLVTAFPALSKYEKF